MESSKPIPKGQIEDYISDATQSSIDLKVNKSGIEAQLLILDNNSKQVGNITHIGDIASFQGLSGVNISAPSTTISSLNGYDDYLVGVGLDGQLIPVKKESLVTYTPTVTYNIPQNLIINTSTKLGALIILSQPIINPTLQWSINYTNTDNQVATVSIRVGLDNIATGTPIIYTVPRGVTLTLAGAAPYGNSINSGTEVSVFIQSTQTAVINRLTIKLNSGVQGDNSSLPRYTVATLPVGSQGYSAYCTDLLSSTYMTTAIGGGSIVWKVFHDGTSWKVG
jgi:hypothetical protein